LRPDSGPVLQRMLRFSTTSINFVNKLLPVSLKYNKKLVYLEPAQDEALRKIAASTRLPQSLLVRDAIDLLIKQYRKRKKLEDAPPLVET